MASLPADETPCTAPPRLQCCSPLPAKASPSPPGIPLYQGDLDADLRTVSRNRLAEQITGGLTLTTKMPCPSWGISAARCQLGALLARKEGTVCSACYARRGRYLLTNVQEKLEERYRGLFHPLWTPAMVFLIRWYADRYFRWFDSGDLQGTNHLRNICTVAAHTPDVRHWLPTREARIVRAVGEFPENLTVRLSAQTIDGEPPPHTTTSRVTTGDAGESFDCPSRKQGNVCGDCRACWDPAIKDVAYRLH